MFLTDIVRENSIFDDSIEIFAEKDQNAGKWKTIKLLIESV